MHPHNCQCMDCQQQGPRDHRAGRGHPSDLPTVIAVIVIAILLIVLVRTWYVDTHCTMVLGTQVCR